MSFFVNNSKQRLKPGCLSLIIDKISLFDLSSFMMTLKKVALILFIISIIVLTVLMLIPDPPQIQSKFKFIDKIEHFAAFFLLAVLFSFAAAIRFSNKLKIFIVTVAVLVSYGIAIEILQQYTGRSTEIMDLLADIGGAVAGSLFSLFFL